MLSNPTVIEFTWPKPIPLTYEQEKSPPYPVQCLPAIIQDAVLSYKTYGKQPVSLIAGSAILLTIVIYVSARTFLSY